jgi:hypothetical protein
MAGMVRMMGMVGMMGMTGNKKSLKGWRMYIGIVGRERVEDRVEMGIVSIDCRGDRPGKNCGP